MRCLPVYLAAALLGLAVAGLSIFSMAQLPAFAATAPHTIERFRLSAAPAAAVGYPMQVLDGHFLPPGSPVNAGFPIAPEYLAGKWGLSAISWGVGDPMQPVPERFWVRWYSYTEDKFYEGHFLLPQARLAALLRQGFWNPQTKQQKTYDELTLCLLPKGVVVLWLTGLNQVLVGRYEGREIAFDFKRFNEAANRPLMVAQEQAKLPPAVQQEIKTNTLSTRRWDAYLATYPWQLAFDRPLQLENYSITYLNAERIRYAPTADQAAHAQTLLTLQPRSVPAHLLLVVDAGYGRRRKIRVDAFDETETLAAFQALGATGQPLTLRVETDERVTQAQFVVSNGQQQLPLPHAKLVVYDAD